jgi:hypothetical protein
MFLRAVCRLTSTYGTVGPCYASKPHREVPGVVCEVVKRPARIMFRRGLDGSPGSRASLE